jgi:hypothetical protein
MINADAMEFARLMAVLAETHDTDISKEKIEVYWTVLKQYELNDVRSAITRAIASPDSSGFIPKPGELIKFIEGNSGSQAARAWSKVMQAISGAGVWNTVVFDDPIIHCVIVDMGGWMELCRKKTDELEFRANDFQKRYAGYLLLKPSTYPRKLAGIHEIENSSNGYPSPAPILIGDEESAKNVLRGGHDGAKTISIKPLMENLLQQMVVEKVGDE